MSVEIDSVRMAVIANRLESIVREMSNTLLRTGRSAILNTARDFSCSIVSAEHELIAAAEGLPIHIVGNNLLSESMVRNHPDLTDGDAFLHNDPYDGNTHHADHTIMVPVMHRGRHLFTTVAKAHQADCGNAEATTYSPLARDVYEEGALSFPCVRVQRDREDVDDIIRMCRMRIRVPDQWYGDYLAGLGAARIGERRLAELIDQFGPELLDAFRAKWLDYSGRPGGGLDREDARRRGQRQHRPRPGPRPRRGGAAERQRQGRLGGGADRRRPARQHRLRPLRPQPLPRDGALGRGDRRPQPARRGHPLQRGLLPRHPRPPARGLGRRHPGASLLLLGGDHQRLRPAGQPGPAAAGRARQRLGAGRGRRSAAARPRA